ncbi:MAG: hypothetical protein ACRETH_02310 [Steroidobacteraceae bacterium]
MEAASGDVADGSRTHTATAAPCLRPRECWYEKRDRHLPGHCISRHSRRDCAGWQWAWSSAIGGHREANADACIDNYCAREALTAKASVSVAVATIDTVWNACAQLGEDGREHRAAGEP